MSCPVIKEMPREPKAVYSYPVAMQLTPRSPNPRITRIIRYQMTLQKVELKRGKTHPIKQDLQ